MQCPQAAQPAGLIGIGEGDLGERLVHGCIAASFGEQQAGLPHIPVVGVELQLDQFQVGLLTQIDGNRFGVLVANLVDATIGPIPDRFLGSVAGLLVVPVEQEDIAVGPVAEIDEACPRVVGQQEIVAVRRHESRASRMQQIRVEPVPVDVPHHHLAAIFLGPGIPQVNHQPAVSVAAAGLVAAVVAAVWRRTHVMAVIGDGDDVGVGVRIEMRAGLPLEASHSE